MAEPGHSLHPSARGRGRPEPRALRLLRLLLWVGPAFQVTQGAGPELHACKEVLSSPTGHHLGKKNLGSRRRSWGLRHRQFQRARSLGSLGKGEEGRGAAWRHGGATPLEDSQNRSPSQPGLLSSGKVPAPRSLGGTRVPGLGTREEDVSCLPAEMRLLKSG